MTQEATLWQHSVHKHCTSRSLACISKSHCKQWAHRKHWAVQSHDPRLRRPDQNLPGGGGLHLLCVTELQIISWFVSLQEIIDGVALARTMTTHAMPRKSDWSWHTNDLCKLGDHLRRSRLLSPLRCSICLAWATLALSSRFSCCISFSLASPLLLLTCTALSASAVSSYNCSTKY